MPSAEQLASLYEGNPDAIAVYDRDGLLLSCNAHGLRLSGYASLEEIRGTHFTQHVFKSDRERVERAFDAALGGLTDHFETTIRNAAGAIVPVEVYLFPARTGGAIDGVFAQARDTIALRQAERSLDANRQRFRSLFEYHPDAIMELNATGEITRVNVAYEAATGYFGEELIGKIWTDSIAPELRERCSEAFREVIRGEAVELDALLLDRLGNRIDVQLNLVPLKMEDAFEGAYAIAKNVTAQRAAEHAVAQHGDRIRELYLAAAARGQSVEAQIDDTLALGCRLFGFDFGYVTRFGESTITILNSTSGKAGVHAGAIYPRSTAFSRYVGGERRTIFVPNLDEPPWDTDPARETAPWRSYFATKLVVNNQNFGAMVFAGTQPHGPISELDLDLLQLMALFVAGALERAVHAERIEQLAFYDSLTGLPNRVLFSDRVKQTMNTARRYGRGFAIMYLDLDDFKAINDKYGHPAGDLVLRAVAERLILSLRDSDTVARFGGDEFVVLQPLVNGEVDARDLAKKIVKAMQPPLQAGGTEHLVHTSIGIALYPQDAESVEELLDRADRALYRAKRSGRNRWAFFGADTAPAV